MAFLTVGWRAILAKRAKQQRSADGGSGSAPVAVHPIAGNAEFEGGEGSTEERPARGHPRAQHPGDGGTHCCGTEQHADPRCPEEFTDGEDQALRRRIDGRIGGQPVDVEGIEAGPHGVGGIGETSVSEGVAHQQVAVFVVNAGNWYRKQGKNGDADGEHAKNTTNSGEQAALRTWRLLIRGAQDAQASVVREDPPQEKRRQ